MAKPIPPKKGSLQTFLQTNLQQLFIFLQQLIIFLKRICVIIFQNLFLVAGSLIIFFTWYQEKVTLADRQENLNKFYQLGMQANLMIHDIKLREFETNNTMIHQNVILNKTDYNGAFWRNVLQESMARNECIYQLIEQRDLIKDNKTKWGDGEQRNRRDSLTVDELANRNDDSINAYRLRDRERFNTEINAIQAEIPTTEKELKDQLESKTKNYLWFYSLGSALIALDWIIKKFKEKPKD